MTPRDDKGPGWRRDPAQRPGTAPNRLRPGSAPFGRKVDGATSGSRYARSGPPGSKSYLGAGALSLLLHGLLLAVLLHTALMPPPPPMAAIPVSILPAPPPPPPPAAAAPAPHPEPEQPAVVESVPVHKQEKRVVEPRRKPTAEPVRPSDAPAPQDLVGPAAEPGGVVGGEAGGVQGGTLGGVVGGHSGGVVGGQGNAPIPADRAAVPPVILSQVRPNYPPLARLRGIEGLVQLEVIIDHEGRVERDSIRVEQSIPGLDEAAREAVRRWRFRPARDAAGRNIRVILEVPIRFQLR